MIQSYGRKFVHVDSGIALQYYMLASVVRGNSIAGKRQHSQSGGKGARREGVGQNVQHRLCMPVRLAQPQHRRL